MPNELASQMPILKDILQAMHIKILEKEGYEGDDILGTLAKWGKKNHLDVTILTGDRDSFQLIERNITVRIPRTKMGKTEMEDFTEKKVKEEYNLKPQDLIELKGLMGDTSDNIPGVPGVGPKTATELIIKYKTIEEVYNHLDEIKGKIKEKLEENKELAFLSRTLGTINTNIDISVNLKDIEIKEWDKQKVYEIFKNLKFNRYIEKFDLLDNANTSKNEYVVHYKTDYDIDTIRDEINKQNILFYYFNTKEENGEIINKEITSLTLFIEKEDTAYLIKDIEKLKDIFENNEILKVRVQTKRRLYIIKTDGNNATKFNVRYRNCRISFKFKYKQIYHRISSWRIYKI